jgi:hypothetical protein
VAKDHRKERELVPVLASRVDRDAPLAARLPSAAPHTF